MDQAQTCGLNAEDCQDLDDVVGSRPCVVDLVHWQDLFEGDAISLDDPVRRAFLSCTCFCLVISPLALWCLLAVGNLGDLWEALESQLVEERVLSPLEQHWHSFVIFVSCKACQSQPEDQLWEVICVLVSDGVDLVLSQLCLEHVVNLLNAEATPSHLGSVELKPVKPGGNVG